MKPLSCGHAETRWKPAAASALQNDPAIVAGCILINVEKQPHRRWNGPGPGEGEFLEFRRRRPSAKKKAAYKVFTPRRRPQNRGARWRTLYDGPPASTFLEFVELSFKSRAISWENAKYTYLRLCRKQLTRVTTTETTSLNIHPGTRGVLSYFFLKSDDEKIILLRAQ